MFKRVEVRDRETFDSSATPKVGQAAARPKKLAPVDLGKLSEQIKATVEAQKQNDPRELRRQLEALKKESKPAVKVEKVSVFTADDRNWLEAQIARAEKSLNQVCYQLENIKAKVDGYKVEQGDTRNQRLHTATAEYFGSGSGSVDLPEGERKILVAVGQHRDGVTRQQLTILTGYKRSTRDAYLARLVGKHLLACTATGVHLTALGLEKLGKGFEPLPVGEALREHWLHVLPKGERQLFQILCLAWPKAQSRDALSEQTGYKRSSRDAYLSRLATRQLVEAVGLGEVKAADTLFEN